MEIQSDGIAGVWRNKYIHEKKTQLMIEAAAKCSFRWKFTRLKLLCLIFLNRHMLNLICNTTYIAEFCLHRIAKKLRGMCESILKM